MSKDLLDRVAVPLRDSIRGQILTTLIGLLFLASLILAAAFYLQARATAMEQQTRAYQVTGSMVADLSQYDFQFNKAGLGKTLKAFAQSDPNILWAEFADASGNAVQGAETPLDRAPYTALGPLPGDGSVVRIETPAGEALLVRAPVKASALPQGEGAGDIGFPATVGPQPEPSRLLGELRFVVSLKTLAELRHRYLVFGALIILLTLLVGTAISLLVTRYVTGPIGEMTRLARRIAEGDLTASAAGGARRDELGRLLATFRSMAANLAAMVRQIRTAFQGVQGDTETVRQVIRQNLEGNREQAKSTEQVADRMTSIQHSAEAVTGLMESLAEVAEEVSSSVIEMITSIDEIARNAEGLTEAMASSASTLTESVAATRQIATSVDTLNRFVEDTASSMNEMEGSIRQVEQNASESRKVTDGVMREAQEGAQAMERSEAVVRELQDSFASTVQVMKILDQKSEEVGNILSVIDEVMEQTHLLALNAAIIAAQAGEHGKSFAVVAGEIRALAEKTSLSTREIAALVDSVQREVQRAVDSVSAQTELVDQAVSVQRDTRAALDRIQGSVQNSLRMVQEIAKATSEQSKGASSIVRSSQQVRDLTHQLRKATQEQKSGSDHILSAVSRARDLAEEVKRATREQSTGSTIIRRAMENLTTAVGKVKTQTQAQTSASKEVDAVMVDFAQSSRSNVAGLQKATEQVEELTRRAEEVGRFLSRFRTEGG